MLIMGGGHVGNAYQFGDTFTDRFTKGTHEISIVSTDADGHVQRGAHLRCIICCGRYRTSISGRRVSLNGNPTRHIGKGCIGGLFPL